MSAMHPAIRACWQAYVARLRLDAHTANHWLLDVVRLCAARLVQTAFEAAQTSMQLTGGIGLHLQVSLNVLQRPRGAAVHLLGLRPHAAMPSV
jgi:alkylation response protein AidB-like acyl-CoA dehydrogenase